MKLLIEKIQRSFLSKITRDLILRTYFSIYYMAATLMWLNNDWINALIPKGIGLFFVDLSGQRVSTEPETYYFINLQEITATNWKYLVLASVLVGICCLMKEKTIRLGATLMLIVIHLLGYSANGRVIQFDIVTYGFMGYWFSVCLLPLILKKTTYDTYWARWLCTVAALATTYSSAGISKIVVNLHRTWANSTNLGIFMHLGRFRYEAYLGKVNIPESIVDFFSTPTVISTILLSLVILFELFAVFLVLFRKTSFLGLFLLLITHVGIFTTINILWPPLIIFLMLLLIIRPVKFTHIEHKTSAVAFALFTVFLILGWSIPSSSRDTNNFASTTYVFPFSQFRMYSSTTDFTKQYFLSTDDSKFIKQIDMLKSLRMGNQHMSILVRNHNRRNESEIVTAKFVCDEVNKRKEKFDHYGFLKNKNLSVSVRNIYYKVDINKVISEDTFLLNCDKSVD